MNKFDAKNVEIKITRHTLSAFVNFGYKVLQAISEIIGRILNCLAKV
jgi:hypothetical protein